MGRINDIIRFVCPTEKEFVNVKNKKVLREKVLYSGYLYFESTKLLEEPKLKEIASMQNIMGMIGEKMPLKLRESDIRRILKDDTLEEHIDAKKLKYIVGESVKVTEGPFSSFVGVINDIKGDKVDIEIKIFGRNTPVTLQLNQIEKA